MKMYGDYSYKCTDTALGEFFHLQCGFQLENHFQNVTNEN